MKHPIEEMNKNQEEFLRKLPEDQKAFAAQIFRIGNATYHYHNNAKELEPTEQDFEEWLEGLPSQVREDFKNRGLEDCKGVLSFTRYVNEKNDIGMEAWMKDHLSKEDWEVFISTKNKTNENKH